MSVTRSRSRNDIRIMRNLIPCFPVIQRSTFLHSTPTDLSLPFPSTDPEPDFAAVIASRRFFFSSPGRSKSIIESSTSTIREDSTESSTSPSDRHSSNESVAMQTYSPDPYADFRRSMEEMVEARGLQDAKANWENLHELLICYLALNHKCAHGFIVRAFTDLLVALMSSTEKKSEGRDGTDSRRSVSASILPL